MLTDELKAEITRLMESCERAGYERAMLDAISRFDMIAAVVPSSVIKQWFIEQAQRESKALRNKVNAGGLTGTRGKEE